MADAALKDLIEASLNEVGTASCGVTWLLLCGCCAVW